MFMGEHIPIFPVEFLCHFHPNSIKLRNRKPVFGGMNSSFKVGETYLPDDAVCAIGEFVHVECNEHFFVPTTLLSLLQKIKSCHFSKNRCCFSKGSRGALHKNSLRFSSKDSVNRVPQLMRQRHDIPLGAHIA